MRIAYNAILLGNYFSGVEVTISTLAKILSRELAHDLKIFLNENAQGDFTFPNADIHPVKIMRNYRAARIIWEHFKMPKLVEKLECDLLHCPGYIAPINPPCPTLVTIHDTIAIKHPELCKTSNHCYYKLNMGGTVKNATQIIVPSGIVKDDLIKLYSTDPDKINIIPFAPLDIFKPVDDEEELARVKNKYKLPDKFILFLGNHEPKKNISGVVSAFAEFRKKVKGYKLLLAGRSAWGTKRHRELIHNLGIEEDIIRPGYIPLGDLSAIYSLADVFLFPSLDEGFGIPVLEAMACGAPVICSDSGALPETTDGAAICVPPNDYALIAEKLANFAEDSDLREKHVEKGFQRVKNLSWDKTAKATMEVYKKALK